MKKIARKETGEKSEKMVKEKLENEFHLKTRKPIPDLGIDLEVPNPIYSDKPIKIQIKGRGELNTGKTYRWFQIQRSKRKNTNEKIALVDFFVLVSLHHQEMWVFTKEEIDEIIKRTAYKYQGRADNKTGQQREINLDIRLDKTGPLVIKAFKNNKNNFKPILDKLNSLNG